MVGSYFCACGRWEPRFPTVLLTGTVDALSYEDRVLFARCIEKGRPIQHLLETIAELVDPTHTPDRASESS